MDSTRFSTPNSRLIVLMIVSVIVGVLKGQQLATDPNNNNNNNIAPPGYAIATPELCNDCSICPAACSGSNVYPPPPPPPDLSYDHVPPSPHQPKGNNCPPSSVVVCCPYAPPPPATSTGAFPYVPYNNYSGSTQTGSAVLGCVISGVFLSWFGLVL